ncbi:MULTISPECIES: amino acid adenylation domain-containing protein [unclassified Ruegeria]|uniref:non-ribosomal peptide synthetase n=1 Tax=unclassified Ruegeria TaxID=2625375 RepID=UPI001488564C|nr:MULTISPECIES: amino acid adenylation domain-containing protein [unclassified Ruegeria]
MITPSPQPEVIDAYPLTPTQSGMLVHILNEPHQAHYFARVTGVLAGALTQEIALEAWQSIMNRHEALRTAFVWDGLEQPLQVVVSEQSVDFEWLEDAPGDVGIGDAPTAADLANAPLWKVRMWPQSEGKTRFEWSIHHLIIDGWSATLILDEFVRSIAQRINGELIELEPAPVFADHARWLAGKSHDDDFWKEYLSGYQPKTHPKTDDKSGFAESSITLTSEEQSRLTAAAQSAGVTVPVAAQAAFSRALGGLLNSDDIVFGLAVSGRSSPMAGVEACVGMFVNNLPMRVDLTSDNLFERVQENLNALREREFTPLGTAARLGGLAPGQPLTDVVLTIRALPEVQSVHGVAIDDLHFRTPSNFSLVVEYDPADGTLSALFNTAHYSQHDVDELFRSFRKAELQHQAELRRRIGFFGPDLRGEPVDIVSRILHQAHTHPDLPAVIYDGEATSYAALLDRASDIAAFLSSRGIGRGDCVAIVLPRGPDIISAMLGTLLTGAAYVPVDRNYPRQRIDYVLSDCAAKAVLSDTESEIENAICIEDVPSSDGFEPVETEEDDLAYVIYTSGSTGAPKGVCISRGNLSFSQAARDQFYPSAPEAFLLISPFAFDSSVVGLYWALTSGGSLVVTKERDEQDIAGLANLIAEQQVSHTLMLPGLYKALLEGADAKTLSCLRTVILAGEAVPETLHHSHVSILPDCILANEYGPTETTVWALADLITPAEDRAMTIGTPIPGTQVLLLDENDRPVKANEIGEICVAGPSLARGYLGRRDETDRAFQHLKIDGDTMRVYRTGDQARCGPDGRFEYLGRGDDQIKIRGHRIEVHEVENVLASLSSVGNAAVVVGPARTVSDDELSSALERMPRGMAEQYLKTALKG